MKSASSILYLKKGWRYSIRKPDFEEEMNTFVTEIRLEYRNRLVLQSPPFGESSNSSHSFYRKQPNAK
jgi:hypothetical protein